MLEVLRRRAPDFDMSIVNVTSPPPTPAPYVRYLRAHFGCVIANYEYRSIIVPFESTLQFDSLMRLRIRLLQAPWAFLVNAIIRYTQKPIAVVSESPCRYVCPKTTPILRPFFPAFESDQRKNSTLFSANNVCLTL
jgi:hypothetical protein